MTCPPPVSGSRVSGAPEAGVSHTAAEARELLSQFALTGKQHPFEEIVRRYSGMVYNVCFEVTQNRHDAEDATQAAFMSLAVQVRSGQQIIAIGPWLQQVARRMSLDLNRSRKRRKNREEKHGEMWEDRLRAISDNGSGGGHGMKPDGAAGWEEIRHVIHEELNQLPAKYRMPLILHYYGGLTREEMARELGVRTNTLGVRLHRAREMLGKRLAKRGVELTGVLVGVLLAEIVRSVVSEHMVASTATAATMLSAGHTSAAGGLVSVQVLEMARAAGRVVVATRLKFAAAMTLLLGGAGAAGAQVAHLDLSRLGELPGKLLNGIRTMGDRPISPPRLQLPTNPGAISTNSNTTPIADPGRLTSAGLNPPAPPWDWRTGTWWPAATPSPWTYIERNTGQGAPETPTVTNPVVRATPGGGKPQLPPPGPVTVTVSSLAKAYTSGSSSFAAAGGGASGGSKEKSESPTVAKSPRKRATPEEPNPQKDPTPHIVRQNQDNQTETTPPGRGGVKPRIPDENVVQDGSTTPQSPPGGTRGHTNPADAVRPRIATRTQPGPVENLFPPGPVRDDGPPIEPPQADKVQFTDPPPQHHLGDSPQGGYLENGVRRINAGAPALGSPSLSIDSLSAHPRGNGVFLLTPADAPVANPDVIVGQDSPGFAHQSGSLHVVDSLFIGVMKSGTGVYQLTGGQLEIVRAASTDAKPRSIEIASAGTGTFLLGNETSTGIIRESGDGLPVNMKIAATHAAQGTLRGWGEVKLTGTLANNGKVIADGYGQDRTLDLSTFATITHQFRTNAAVRGWYAQSGGRLELPAIHVQASAEPQTYTWGENAALPALSMVNSARVTLTGVAEEAELRIALLALDRADLPALPQGHTFISAWTFDLTNASGDPSAEGIDLVVRYDDARAHELGLDETVLKLWTHQAEGWIRHDFDTTFLRDSATHTLSVHLPGADFTHFAVSAPEPATIGLLTLAATYALTKRRRRPN